MRHPMLPTPEPRHVHAPDAATMRPAGMMLRRSTLAALLMMSIVQGGTAADPIAVRAVPAQDSVGLGAFVDIAVHVDDAANLHGSQITMAFDPAVLQLVSVADGDVYPSDPPGHFFQASPDSSAHADSVQVTQTILGTSGFTGTGTLFTVTLRAVGYGDAAVVLRNTDLRDIADQPIEHEPEGVTVRAVRVKAGLKVILQGPFASDTMATALRTLGVLPAAHPYGGTPWSYAGTDSAGTIPAHAVDWILVEARTGTASSTRVAVRAGFLRKDGMVVDLDGTSALAFTDLPAGAYHLVIHHRNHLAVMTSAAVQLDAAPAVYDLSAAQSKAYGTNAMKPLGPGSGAPFGLFAADGNASGVINATDRNLVWRPQNGSVNGYFSGDFNLSSTVNATDRNLYWRLNNGILGQVP